MCELGESRELKIQSAILIRPESGAVVNAAARLIAKKQGDLIGTKSVKSIKPQNVHRIFDTHPTRISMCNAVKSGYIIPYSRHGKETMTSL